MTKVSDSPQRNPLIETRSIDYIPEAERHGVRSGGAGDHSIGVEGV